MTRRLPVVAALLMVLVPQGMRAQAPAPAPALPTEWQSFTAEEG